MPREGRTILDDLSLLSLEVNGLFITHRAAGAVLSRHTLALTIHSDHPDYPIYIRGSGTALKYKGRYLLLSTQHQLGDLEDFSRVSLITLDGSRAVSSSGVRYRSQSSEHDAYDMIAFDFTEAIQHVADVRACFFDFALVPPSVPEENIAFLILSGYICSEQTFYDEPRRLGLNQRRIVCAPHFQPSDHSTLTVRPIEPLPVDPDGLSGGAAFVVQNTTGQFRAYFAGIILRGGRNDLHILKVGYISSFLESISSTWRDDEPPGPHDGIPHSGA